MLLPSVAGHHVRGQRVVVRSGEGIKDLISRDRKEVELTTAFDEPTASSIGAAVGIAGPTAAAEAPATTSTSAATAPSHSSNSSRNPRQQRGPKTRRQRQADMAQAAETADSSNSSSVSTQPRFKRCKDAIDAGLEAFQAKDFRAAIDLFNLALELPGNGAYRLPGSPREYSCPSDGEEHAALYNMACCYAQLGQKQAALTCLESVLETGFSDVQTLSSDPDLRPVQGPELQAIINKYTGVGGIFTKLMKQNKEEVLVSDQNKNKPWILW
jgi:tetratricopeptide (TPR) repeat protein